MYHRIASQPWLLLPADLVNVATSNGSSVHIYNSVPNLSAAAISHFAVELGILFDISPADSVITFGNFFILRDLTVEWLSGWVYEAHNFFCYYDFTRGHAGIHGY